jgi:hypothetical protein
VGPDSADAPEADEDGVIAEVADDEAPKATKGKKSTS